MAWTCFDTVGLIEPTQAIVPRMNRGGRLVSSGGHGTDNLLALQDLRYSSPVPASRRQVDRAAEAWNLIQTKAEPILGVILDWTASG